MSEIEVVRLVIQLTGLGLKDACDLLAKKGIFVFIQDRGWVFASRVTN